MNNFNFVIGNKLYPSTEPLPQAALKQIFDNYNASTIQRMVAGRGGKSVNKKQVNINTLAELFYDKKTTKKALELLGSESREVLARIIQFGENGVMPFSALRNQLIATHSSEFILRAFSELTTQVLLIYITRRSDTNLAVELLYNKHDVLPGSLMPYGNNPNDVEMVVWLPLHVRELFQSQTASGFSQPNKTGKSEPASATTFTFSLTKVTFFQPALSSGENEAKPGKSANKSLDLAKELLVKQPARFEALLADIFNFSRYIEQNQIVALQAGIPGKRDFNKIAGLLTSKEQLSQEAMAAKKIDDVPYLNFLWRIMLNARLVKLDAFSNLIQPGDELLNFFNLPRPEQIHQLTEAWAASNLTDFTAIQSLIFLFDNIEVTSVPTLTKEQQARQQLLKLWQKWATEPEPSLPTEAERWLSFATLKQAVKERAFDLLIDHNYVKTTNKPESYFSSAYYYTFRGDFGPNYYNGFVSKLKPLPTRPNAKYYSASQTNAPLSLDNDWDLVEGEWLAYLIGQPLSWLGLTELGLDPASKRPVAFRFTTAGIEYLTGQLSDQAAATQQQLAHLAATRPELAKPLIIQPNFELLVLDPLKHLPLLRQLEQFAVQLTMGDVAQYSLTKESVVAGLRDGLAIDAIINLLKSNSRVPLSQNIETSLLDWGQAFERLKLRQNATLLEVARPEILDRLTQLQPDLLDKRIGTHFALLKPEKLGLLEQIVAKHQLLVTSVSVLGATSLPNGKSKVASTVSTSTQPLVINTAQTVRGRLTFEDAYTIQMRQGTPYLLYQVGKFANLVSWESSEQKTTFKLTPQSLARAKSLKLNARTIQEIYQAWLPAKAKAKATEASKDKLNRNRREGLGQPPGMDLPATESETLLAIKSWLGEYDDYLANRTNQTVIQTEPVVLWQVAIPALLDDLFAVARFQGYLLARPLPTLALIRQNEAPALQKELTELGFIFKEGIDTVVPPRGINHVTLSELPGRGMQKAGLLSGAGAGGLEELVLRTLLGQGLPARAGRGASLDNLLNSAGAFGDFGETEYEDDYYGYGEDDTPENVTDLLPQIMKMVKENGIGQGKENFKKVTAAKFANLLLEELEGEGYEIQTSSPERVKNWETRHIQGHFYIDLSPTQRYKVLEDSCIEGLAREPEPEKQAIQEVALELIEYFQLPVARRVTEFLYQPNIKVRYNACRCLGSVGDRESLTHLQPLLYDATPVVVSSGQKVTLGEAAQEAYNKISGRYH